MQDECVRLFSKRVCLHDVLSAGLRYLSINGVKKRSCARQECPSQGHLLDNAQHAVMGVKMCWRAAKSRRKKEGELKE